MKGMLNILTSSLFHLGKYKYTEFYPKYVDTFNYYDTASYSSAQNMKMTMCHLS